MRDARVLYVTMFGVSAAAAFSKNFLYAWLLPPEQFGLVVLALLIITVTASAAVGGVYEGLSREIPLRRGAGEDTVALRCNSFSAALALSFVTAGTLAAVGLIVSFWYPDYSVIWWSAPLLVSVVAFNGMLCDLQAREHSVAYASILASKSIATLLLAAAFSGAGAVGIISAEVAANIAFAVICLRVWSRDLRWMLRPAHSARAMIRVGLPFAVGNFVQNLGMTADRWAVQLSLGVAALGVYSFAMHFASIGLVLINMVSLYVTPRALREHGGLGDPAVLIARVKRVAGLTITFFLVAALPFLLLYPVLVSRWFPQYSEAIPLVVWVYLGAAGITVGFHDILFRALGDGRGLLRIQSWALVAAIAGSAVAIALQAPLVAYAAVFALVRLGSAAAGWIVGVHRLRRAW